MEKHFREPIRHTCPDIDKYIRSIKHEMTSDRELKSYDERLLYDIASSMNAELERCIGYLESLRESNHELRSWGILEAERVDELEMAVENLQGQIDDLKAGDGENIDSPYRLMPTLEQIMEPIEGICDEFKKSRNPA